MRRVIEPGRCKLQRRGSLNARRSDCAVKATIMATSDTAAGVCSTREDTLDGERPSNDVEASPSWAEICDTALADAGSEAVRLLTQRGWMVCTAESCTAGFISKVLTDRGGSSSAVYGGYCVYDNEAKERMIGHKLAANAVSATVVSQLTQAVLANTPERVQIGVAVSGVCGPGGAPRSHRLVQCILGYRRVGKRLM